MRNTKNDLVPDFEFILNRFNNKYPLCSKEFNYLFNKRIQGKTLLLRPFLSKLIFELGGKSDWNVHTRLFALVEIINISTYQSNLAFDNKNGINNELDKFNQIISAFFSTFVFFDEVIISKYNENTRLKIIDVTVNGLKDIYYGQYLDLNIMKFSNESLYDSFDEFEKKYLLRCYHLGSSLINLCVNYCLIVNNSNIEAIKDELLRFGTLFGLAGQILNDLGDITSKGRVYSANRYSDIKNEKLTLPILFLMEISGDKRPNIDNLIDVCKNDIAITNLINKVKSYLLKYIFEINSLMKTIEAKGFNVEELIFLSNILEKSNFLKKINHEQ